MHVQTTCKTFAEGDESFVRIKQYAYLKECWFIEITSMKMSILEEGRDSTGCR